MARSYAQLHQRIWADPDWRALDLGAQHLYILLISQPQTNLAGVIPLQLRKWASCVDGWDIADVANALDRLRVQRFVIVDDDTEEVLVRTLIRNDGGYKTPGMLKSILVFAEQAQSPAIRRALADELGRLDPLNGKTAEEGTALISATRLVLAPPSGPSGPGGEPIPDGMADGIRDGIPDAFIGTHPGCHPGCHPQSEKEPIPDTSVTGTGTGPLLSLVGNQRGKSAPPPPDEPPLCAKHEGMDRDLIPGCRACKRLRENWEMARDEAAKPKPLPPLCGQCDNRWIETESGAMARCPRCNPRAQEAS